MSQQSLGAQSMVGQFWHWAGKPEEEENWGEYNFVSWLRIKSGCMQLFLKFIWFVEWKWSCKRKSTKIILLPCCGVISVDSANSTLERYCSEKASPILNLPNKLHHILRQVLNTFNGFCGKNLLFRKRMYVCTRIISGSWLTKQYKQAT